MNTTKKYITIAIALIISTASMAQGEVKKGTMMQEDLVRESIILKMKVPTDEAKDLFDKFMDKTYNVKVGGLGFLGNKDEVMMEKVKIPAISPNTMDLFAEFRDAQDGQTIMSIAGREGYDMYFSTDHKPEAYKKLKSMMNDFRVYAQKEFLTETIDDESKTVENLTDDYERAQKKIAKNKRDIEDNLEDNEKMKKENAELAKESKKLQMRKAEMEKKVDAKKSTLNGLKK